MPLQGTWHWGDHRRGTCFECSSSVCCRVDGPIDVGLNVDALFVGSTFTLSLPACSFDEIVLRAENLDGFGTIEFIEEPIPASEVSQQ